MELVGVGLVGEDRGLVVIGERLPDRVGVVVKVEDEHVPLARMRPVEPRQGLDRPDAGERLVHVHRVEERLVVAGLELVGADEEPVGVFAKRRGDPCRRETVQAGFGRDRAVVLLLARERDDRPAGAPALDQIVADRVEVLDRPHDAAGDDHRPGPASHPAGRNDLFVEVVHHDLGLEPDRVIVPLHIAPELLVGLLHVELGVVLHFLRQPVVAVHRGVVSNHVEDEALLDRLLHAVVVEGAVLDRSIGLRVGFPEDLQRLVLGRGGEGEVAGVGEQLPRLHQPVDLIFVSLRLAFRSRFAERAAHRSGGLPALAGVRLVNDDSEVPTALLVADLVEDERELLDRGDDDLLALLDGTVADRPIARHGPRWT